MTKHATIRLALILMVALLATLVPAIAQESDAEAADTQEGAEGLVFTNDELEKRLADAGAPTTVFTNDDLKADEPEAEDEGEADADEADPIPRAKAVVRAQPAGAAFTNDDLKERFGNEEAEAAAALAEAIGEAPPAEEAAAEPAEPAAPAEPAEPKMSDAERSKQIAEIDAQLKHLEKRLLAIRNPLLAGTEPASEEESKAQAGMDNADRARTTEEKIEELRRSLDELDAGGE